MLTLIATNDFHSSVLSGLGSLASLLQWRSEGAIVLDAGDFFAGSSFYEYAGGGPASKLLEGLFDAIVPGNHDLADLQHLKGSERFPVVVCTNLSPSVSLSCQWAKSFLIEHHNLAVGIVGFIGEQAFFAIPPDERKGFEFTPPIFSLLAEECALLKRSGANVIVGISHSGFELDINLQKQYGLFDVLFSAHCHSPNYVWTDERSHCHVVKAPEYGQGLARVHLNLSDVPEVYVDWLMPDAKARSRCMLEWPWMQETLSEYETWRQELMGRIKGGFSIGRDDLMCQIAETVSTAMGGRVVILNRGAIRHGLPVVVNRSAFTDALPFDSDFVDCYLSYTFNEIVAVLQKLGEDVVVRGKNPATNSIITTRYLAQRLQLPFRNLAQPLTLRTAARSLMMEVSK